jgi:trimethylamine-N-oxide reductase (cytochrome c)
LDDITWLREIETCKVLGPDGYQYEPVWINPIDAEKKGVKHGDIVKIINDRGWVLGGAYVTERIRPGVIYQDHGARLDPIVAGVSDRSGANNLICPANVTSKNCPGEVTSGFLVDFEKTDVFELAKQYPEAFARKYDQGVGVSIENYIIKE